MKRIEVERTDVHESTASLPRAELVDHEIEAHCYRKGFEADEGVFCVTIQPGDELGQLHVNVQFEGPIHNYEFCMDNQNDVLLNVAEWLRDFLVGEEGLGGDFVVDLDGAPCPEAEQRLVVDLAARVISRELEVVSAKEAMRQEHGQAVEHREERRVGRGHTLGHTSGA